jgi:hypothetical protein
MILRRWLHMRTWSGRAVAAMFALLAIVVAFESAKRRERGSCPDGHAPFVARALEEKYGVTVACKDQKYPVNTYHGLIRATNAETAQVDRYGTVLAQEFLLYPPDFIRRSRLKRIILCRDLSFDGQDRAAVPDFEHDALYLDVIASDSSRLYERSAIHHDFFHMIDYRDDGQVYADEQWAKLNPATFQYGDGGVNMQGDPRSGVPWDKPGFLNRYATSGVEEDKAEIFAHMMTEYALVGKRAATDDVIYKKMSAMKALLAKFCPDLNEIFWDELSHRQSLNH